MIGKNLKDKLSNEQPLDLAETLALDEALESQAPVARVVSNLPEPEPSLTWRSRLNTRLAAASAARRRRFTLGWAAGVLATGAAAFALVSLLPVQPPSESVVVRPRVSAAKGVEESLVSAHREAELESGMGVSWPVAQGENGPGSL